MFLTIAFVAVFIAAAPLLAFAGHTHASEDYEGFDEGIYTQTELKKDRITYSGNEQRCSYEIKTAASQKKYLDISCAKEEGDTSGVGGGMSVYTESNFTVGSLVLDTEVSGGGVGSKTTRNLFILKSSSQSIYTMQIDVGGLLGGATQGSYNGMKNFTGVQYVQDSDGFYSLRMVLSRAKDTDPWIMKVYDRLTSLSEPIYKIEIPADSLKYVNRILMVDLWNSSTSDCYACIKSARLYTADYADVLTDLAFENIDGSAAEEYKGADTLYAKLDMNNILTRDISLIAVMSVYNSDMLKKAAVYPISLTEGQTLKDESLELDMSDVTAYDRVSFMIWESNELIPLMSAQRLVYSNESVSEDRLVYRDSNMIRLIPDRGLIAEKAIPESFTVTHGDDTLKVNEVCFDSTLNELTIYIDSYLPVTEQLKVTSNSIGCTAGGSVTIDSAVYPYPTEARDLYSFGLISIALYDSAGKPTASAQNSGEYTAVLRFANNSGAYKNCRGVLCAKNNSSERLLDKFNIRMNNYSEYEYTKKISLNKDDVITLIIED